MKNCIVSDVDSAFASSRISLKLVHRHRAGGCYYATSLRASPLLVMLLFPVRFPFEVRPFALKGNCFQPSPAPQEFD